MKIKHSLLLLLLFPFTLFAQKKDLSMQQAVIGLYTDLKVADLSQLQFCGRSDFYSYILEKDSTEVLFIVDPNNHVPQVYMTLDQMNELLKTQNEKENKGFPSIQWIDATSFYFHKNNSTFLVNKEAVNLNIKKLWTLPNGNTITAEDPNKAQLAFVNEDNLYIAAPSGNLKITDDGNENIVYGQAVHRNEFGINGGSFWSPKSNFLAFYRMDQSMVNDYPIIDWETVPAKSKNIKYPMAGGRSHEVTLGVYDASKKTTKYLNIEGPKDQYLTSVSWSPDEQYIYVGVLNRAQNHLDFNKYSTSTGKKIKTIFTEKNSKYVEPQHPLWFYNNNPDEFIWLSQRDGFMHMYSFKKDLLKRQVTKGNWIVNEILGYYEELDEVIFTATKDGAMEQNIYGVTLSNGNIRRITSQAGWHSPQLSKNGAQLIDKYRRYDTPNNIDILSVGNPAIQKRLFTASDPLENYKLAKNKLVKIPVENNIILNGKLIYPIDFDSNKKYPAIVYLYNGPHVQLVKEGYPSSGNLWYDYMAAKGYFIFVMDGRGSSNRGFEFESATHKKLGEIEMRDQLKGVEFLTSLPFIDANRLGVHGWSFGGYMTTSLMTKYPKVFKCGVAGGPVMDWKMYEIMYTERYMASPDSASNQAGYDKTRLWDKAKNLENNLLIIHGAQDDVVVWQHSMKFIRDAVKNNKPVDYFIYPSHPHNVRGRDRIHLMQKITDYFELYLK